MNIRLLLSLLRSNNTNSDPINDTNSNHVDFTKKLPNELLSYIVSYLPFSDQVSTASVNKQLQDINERDVRFFSRKIFTLNTKLERFQTKKAAKQRQLAYSTTSSQISPQANMVATPFMGAIVIQQSSNGPDFITKFFIQRSIKREEDKITNCQNALRIARVKKETILSEKFDQLNHGVSIPNVRK